MIAKPGSILAPLDMERNAAPKRVASPNVSTVPMGIGKMKRNAYTRYGYAAEFVVGGFAWFSGPEITRSRCFDGDGWSAVGCERRADELSYAGIGRDL